MVQPPLLHLHHLLRTLDHVLLPHQPTQEAQSTTDEVPDFERFGGIERAELFGTSGREAGVRFGGREVAHGEDVHA